MEQYDVLIVGAGISGATIAERCTTLGLKVLVVDKRDHIGGNVYDYVDDKTGIRVSKYGAHIFHTNDEEVWEYVNRFSAWRRWDHKVLGLVDGKHVPIPVNMETVNGLFDTHLQTEQDMMDWLHRCQIPCENPRTSKEIALSRVGEKLYQKLFRNYTYKQWNRFPEEMDASVLARIPVRTNTDCRYFTDKYQALPTHGYTAIVNNMLSHPLITVRLNTSYEDIQRQDTLRYKHLVYTGPIDSYFQNAGLPSLEYRSIQFHTEVYETKGYYQPVSVVNYPDTITPYTRTVEYKHFLNQSSDFTIVVHETTNDTGEPYYPVPNTTNQTLYNAYKALADKETTEQHVGFVGRLATYKYFNMDQAIRAALDYFNTIIKDKRTV